MTKNFNIMMVTDLDCQCMSGTGMFRVPKLAEIRLLNILNLDLQNVF